MQCPKCGQPIRLGSRLCPNCGAWLGESEAPENLDTGKLKAAGTNPAGFDFGDLSAGDTYIVPPPSSTASQVPVTRAPVAPPTVNQSSGLGSWGPPNAAHRVEQPAPFGVGANEPGDMVPEFEEATTLSARRSKPQYWTLTLPNGIVELVTGRIVIGRQPEFMPSLPSARLIPVPDPTRSVSKNHACFSISGAALVVEDLGSTNGIIVTRPDGHEHDIGVRGRTELEAGARVELGDVVLTVGKV